MTSGGGIPLDERTAPQLKILEKVGDYAKFSIEPLEQGYGVTIGNPLRRVLLSSLPGTAITQVKIDGVLHEYSTIPHVKEDVLELLLNFKAIRIRSHTDRPGKMRLEASGQREVKAGDIIIPSEFEIVNPDLHIASLDSPEAKLCVEFTVERGKGFVPAKRTDGLPIGVLPVDALFTPVRKVNYSVERTRVGHITDFERLILEVWTDGTITPTEAVRQAAQILMDHFFLFTSLKGMAETGEVSAAFSIPAEMYNIPLDNLGIPTAILNRLKSAKISRLGEVLEKSRDELLKIRNFGEKSLEVLTSFLAEKGMIPEGHWMEGEKARMAEESSPEEGEDAP